MNEDTISQDTSSSTIITLELTPKLQQEDIVTRFIFNHKNNNLILLLNHEYEEKTIVSPVYDDWIKTTSRFERQLNSKGVSPDHALQLCDTVDNNYEKILELKSKSKGKRSQQEQDANTLSQETRKIYDDIKRLRTENPNISYQDWAAKLFEKYNTLHTSVVNYLPNLWAPLELALSIKTILNIKDCTLPFAGILLGPPSSLKTVVVELFRGWPQSFYTDNFSARALVSHNSGVSEEELSQIDMLPRLKNKFFLTPELAPTFAAKDEDLLQVLGIMTRILDGHGYESDTGAHGHRGYNQEIMFTWLGAAVDIPHKVHKHLSTLGPKLYFFRLSNVKENEDHYYYQRHDDFAKKIQEICSCLVDYLKWFEVCWPQTQTQTQELENSLPKIPWDYDKDEELPHRFIIRLANLLSRLRAVVPTWASKNTQGSEYAYSIAIIEDPSRAITQLRNLARGHALSQGRNYITEDDVPVVVHTVLSTASIERATIFNILIANKGTLSSSEIVECLNTSKPTALRTMTELKATGLVDVDTDDGYSAEKRITLKEEFEWFLTPEFQTRKEKSPPHRQKNDEFIETHDNHNTENPEKKEVGGGENSLHYSPSSPTSPIFPDMKTRETPNNDITSDKDKTGESVGADADTSHNDSGVGQQSSAFIPIPPSTPSAVISSNSNLKPETRTSKEPSDKARDVGLPEIPCIFCDYRDCIDFDLITHYLERHKPNLFKLPIGKGSMEYRADYAVKLAKQKLAEADIGDEEASNDA